MDLTHLCSLGIAPYLPHSVPLPHHQGRLPLGGEPKSMLQYSKAGPSANPFLQINTGQWGSCASPCNDESLLLPPGGWQGGVEEVEPIQGFRGGDIPVP